MNLKFSPLLILLVLLGCAAAPISEPPAFVPAEWDSYPATGTAKISGQAFSKTRGGDVKFGAGSTIYLYRATPYLKEFIRLRQAGYIVNHNQDALLAMNRTAISTTADGSGNFSFEKVPAGEYLLECSITWMLPNGGSTGGAVQKFISVQEGQDLKIMLTP